MVYQVNLPNLRGLHIVETALQHTEVSFMQQFKII